MTGSTVHNLKHCIFQPEYLSWIYIRLLKINLFTAADLRGTQLSTGRQADCEMDQQPCVRDHVSHSLGYNKPHPHSTQQASLRDHGIRHQVSRIDGCVFPENQVLSLPLQPAVPENMR
jgi:hypothetical protein